MSSDLEPRQLFGAGLDRVGQLQQEPTAIGGGHTAPGRKSLAGRRDRLVDVGRVGLGHLGDARVVVRIENFDSAASLGVDEFAPDE